MKNLKIKKKSFEVFNVIKIFIYFLYREEETCSSNLKTIHLSTVLILNP